MTSAAPARAVTLEATARGLFVHQMIGILPDRVRELYQVPDGFRPLTGLAIGYLGNPETLPDTYKQREHGPRQRKPLREIVFAGHWGVAPDFVE